MYSVCSYVNAPVLKCKLLPKDVFNLLLTPYFLSPAKLYLKECVQIILQHYKITQSVSLLTTKILYPNYTEIKIYSNNPLKNQSRLSGLFKSFSDFLHSNFSIQRITSLFKNIPEGERERKDYVLSKCRHRRLKMKNRFLINTF